MVDVPYATTPEPGSRNGIYASAVLANNKACNRNLIVNYPHWAECIQ